MSIKWGTVIFPTDTLNIGAVLALICSSNLSLVLSVYYSGRTKRGGVCSGVEISEEINSFELNLWISLVLL